MKDIQFGFERLLGFQLDIVRLLIRNGEEKKVGLKISGN
jgi:hypothetical protein